MIFRTCENLTRPKAGESFFSDLLVVGGGCSGLAAISAAADLGIENSLLLEKEESLGGRLGKCTEEISGLFAKTLQPKELLSHFSLFLENYEVPHRVGVEIEEIYLLSGEEALPIAHTQDEASAYRYLLKAKTKENLIKREETRIENEYRGKVVDAVVDTVNFEIPEAVVEREIQFQINRFAQQLQMQGMSLNQYFEMTGQDIEKMRESIKESAEKSVKRDLVLTEIAKAENVQATEEEVNAELDRTALMYGMDREGLIAEVRKSGNYARFIDEIKYQIINRKTVDLLAK